MTGGPAGAARFGLGLAVALLSGCAVRPAPVCQPSTNVALSAELLFGLSSPSGPISGAAFTAFAQSQITPRFASYTIQPATGLWMGRPEGARAVLIAAPDRPATLAALDAIRAAYKRQFHQQSVGLITTRSCADFTGP